MKKTLELVGVASLILSFSGSLASCSGPRPAATPAPEGLAFWQPHLLYLKRSPYPCLHVEVDAVEGCEPNEDRLERLHAFLAAHCDKPAGITIVRDEVIPKRDASGWPSQVLARRHVSGPPGGRPAAFLYVLFYDGGLCDKPNPSGAPTVREGRRKPHVSLIPYPAAIMINTRYAAAWDRYIGSALLRHEAGHLLGLSRHHHSSGYHCRNAGCLMQPDIAVDLSRLLTGRDPVTQHELCADCAAELRLAARRAPDRNLRFVGPVLVRSESGYHVLSLPGYVKVVLGSLSEKDCRDYAARVRADSRTREENEPGMRSWLDAKLPLSPAHRRALECAEKDPMEVVRHAAIAWRTRIDSR